MSRPRKRTWNTQIRTSKFHSNTTGFTSRRKGNFNSCALFWKNPSKLLVHRSAVKHGQNHILTVASTSDRFCGPSKIDETVKLGRIKNYNFDLVKIGRSNFGTSAAEYNRSSERKWSQRCRNLGTQRKNLRKSSNFLQLIRWASSSTAQDWNICLVLPGPS